MNYIFNININYNNLTKKEIYLEITKLLTTTVDRESFVAYETNITDIIPIITDYFYLSTSNKKLIKCLPKKNSEKNNDKLRLLCFVKDEGKDSLININGIIQDNINILYNFIITSNNNEIFTVTSSYGTILHSVYPEELDFNKQDSFILKYRTANPKLFTGIKLNFDSADLPCSKNNDIKECTVTQSHFTKSGDYYTYHDNHDGKYGVKSISYEITTIKVILKNKSDLDSETKSDSSSESDSDIVFVFVLIGSIIGGLIIIGLIVFFVLKHRKKKFESKSNEKLLKRNIELTDKN